MTERNFGAVLFGLDWKGGGVYDGGWYCWQRKCTDVKCRGQKEQFVIRTEGFMEVIWQSQNQRTVVFTSGDYNIVTVPMSCAVSLHISPQAQHRRCRFSGSVLSLFSSGAPILT